MMPMALLAAAFFAADFTSGLSVRYFLPKYITHIMQTKMKQIISLEFAMRNASNMIFSLSSNTQVKLSVPGCHTDNQLKTEGV